MHPEWCPCVKVSVVVTPFDHREGSRKSPFHCLPKLSADHHCAPGRGRPLPAVPEHCLCRTSWRTWEKPHVGALIRATPPAQGLSPEAGGIPQLFVPPTKRDDHTTDPRLRHLDMTRNPRSLRLRNYRTPGRWSSSERELRNLSWGPSRSPTYWLRVDPGPHVCYPYGRNAPLACVPAIRGPRLSDKKLSVLFHGSPFSPPSLSAKDRIAPETLLIMSPIQCASIIIVTLCFCLTRRPDQNKAVAPYNLITDSDEVRVISICCYPQCGLGPDVPDEDLSCRMSRYSQWKSPSLTWKGNRPRLGGSLIVRTCAVLSNEKFTGAPLAPRLNRPPAVMGTEVNTFPREVDPPRVPKARRKGSTRRPSRFSSVLGTVLDISPPRMGPPRVIEAKRKVSIPGVNRIHATEPERDHPVRRSGSFRTAAPGDRTNPVGRPLSVIPRAFSSVDGAAVRVRTPFCECDLVGRISVRVRRVNQSWTTRTKGVIPTKKIIRPYTAGATGTEEAVHNRRVDQLGTAGATGSEEMIPSRRVNRLCTTSCATKREREREDSVSVSLLRSESRSLERGAVERTCMPLDTSEMGA